MPATIAGTHLGPDIHANRPAANAAGQPVGALYSCTTHGLIYKTDGSAWSTYATLGTSGAIVDPMTTRGDIIVRDSSNTTARLAKGAAGRFLTSDGTDVAYGQGPLTTTGDLMIGATGGTPTRLAAGSTAGHVLTSNGAGAAPSWQAGTGGSSTAMAAALKAIYLQTATNGTSDATTITAAASGDRIVVVVSSRGRDVTAPVCTNVTFTEVLAVSFSTTIFLSVYVGVVAGGSSGTTVTTSATGSNWIIQDVYVIADALTPTAGSSSTGSNTSAAALANTTLGPVATTIGDFFVIAATDDDGTTAMSDLRCSSPAILAPRGGNSSLISGIGRAGGTSIAGYFSGGTSGSDTAMGIIVVS